MEKQKLKLQSIIETVEQIAEVIAMVLGIEVTIIDQKGERLYVTGSYKDSIEPYVSLDSVFSEVLEGKKDQAVTDKLQSMTCRECSYREKCLELANLCAPITLDGEILGLISLIAFDDDQRQRLVDNQEAYRKFIEKMANFLESKMMEVLSKHRISIQKIQLEAILNGVDEGIISVDAKGEILFINETESFATVVVREVSTNTRIELRLESTHPNKNAIMAILLTAVSMDEIVRIRWETANPPTPPLLKRVAINRL